MYNQKIETWIITKGSITIRCRVYVLAIISIAVDQVGKCLIGLKVKNETGDHLIYADIRKGKYVGQFKVDIKESICHVKRWMPMRVIWIQKMKTLLDLLTRNILYKRRYKREARMGRHFCLRGKVPV